MKFTNIIPITPIVASAPMQRVQCDLIEYTRHPSTVGKRIYLYILSVMDVFSRYTRLRPITKKSAKIVTENVKTIFEVFGCPAIVQCDNGGEFLGDFSKYLKENKISVIQSSPNHPQSQGKVERMHGTLKRLINYDYLKHDNICVWERNILTYERLLNEVHK